MLYHYNNIFPNIPKEIQAKFLANHPPKMQEQLTSGIKPLKIKNRRGATDYIFLPLARGRRLVRASSRGAW